MSEVLGSVFSTADSFKRKMIDALRNPKAKLEQIVGDANDRARNLNDLISQSTDEFLQTGGEYGPASRRLAEAMANAYNPAGITVWHGSPHGPFTKFDAKKIGSGEGAQAYGMGHYTAEARATGEDYRKALSSKVNVNGKPLYDSNKIVGSTGNSDLDDYLVANLGDVPATRKQILEDIRFVRKGNPEGVKDMQATLAALRKAKVDKKEAGYLYKIDLPDEHVASMLDWDKPLSKQSPSVQEALAGMGYKVDRKKVDAYSDALLDALASDTPASIGKQPLDMSGESIYRQLTKNASNINAFAKQRDALISKYQKKNMSMSDAVRAMSSEDRAQFARVADQIDNTKNSSAVVSEALRQAGIPGIRYLDQGSRNAGQGTSNFVVFPGNEDMLQILEVNGQPIIDALRKRK